MINLPDSFHNLQNTSPGWPCYFKIEMYLHSAELDVVAVTENVNTFLLVWTNVSRYGVNWLHCCYLNKVLNSKNWNYPQHCYWHLEVPLQRFYCKKKEIWLIPFPSYWFNSPRRATLSSRSYTWIFKLTSLLISLNRPFVFKSFPQQGRRNDCMTLYSLHLFSLTRKSRPMHGTYRGVSL